MRALGDWHAANGRWAEAAARFESLSRVNQLDHPGLISEDQLKLAVALLQSDQLTTSGDRRWLRELPRKDKDEFQPATDPPSDSVVKACLLLPPDPELLELLVSRLGLAPTAEYLRSSDARKSAPRSPVVGNDGACWNIAGEISTKITASEFLVDHSTEAISHYVHQRDGRAGRRKTTGPPWEIGSRLYILIQAAEQQGAGDARPRRKITPEMEQRIAFKVPGMIGPIAGVLMRECNEVIAAVRAIA